MSEAAAGSNVSGEQLAAFIDRIERVSEEKDGLTADIRDIYAEIKAVGFDVKIVRAVVRRRKLERAERQEHDALLETYEAALGE